MRRETRRHVRARLSLYREALVALIAARALVRRRGGAPLASALADTRTDDATRAVDDGELSAIARAVTRLGKGFGARRCLIEALAARTLLDARGIPHALRFAVSRRGGALSSHAWIEAGGRVVVGVGPGAHVPLETHDERRARALAVVEARS